MSSIISSETLNINVCEMGGSRCACSYVTLVFTSTGGRHVLSVFVQGVVYAYGENILVDIMSMSGKSSGGSKVIGGVQRVNYCCVHLSSMPSSCLFARFMCLRLYVNTIALIFLTMRQLQGCLTCMRDPVRHLYVFL